MLASESYEYYIWWDKNGIKHELKPKIEYEKQKFKLLKALNHKDDRYGVITVLLIKEKADLSKIPSNIDYKTLKVLATYKTAKIKTMITPQKIIPCTQ